MVIMGAGCLTRLSLRVTRNPHGSIEIIENQCCELCEELRMINAFNISGSPLLSYKEFSDSLFKKFGHGCKSKGKGCWLVGFFFCISE